LRFLFVGGLNTALAYAIYFVLTEMGVWYLLANTIGFAVSLVNSYVWNKFFVFKKRGKSVAEILKFLLVYGVQYAVGISFLYVAVEYLGIHPHIAAAVNIVLCAGISFAGHKYITYR
jgi:putative flippase GtrA